MMIRRETKGPAKGTRLWIYHDEMYRLRQWYSAVYAFRPLRTAMAGASLQQRMLKEKPRQKCYKIMQPFQTYKLTQCLALRRGRRAPWSSRQELQLGRRSCVCSACRCDETPATCGPRLASLQSNTVRDEKRTSAIRVHRPDEYSCLLMLYCASEHLDSTTGYY